MTGGRSAPGNWEPGDPGLLMGHRIQGGDAEAMAEAIVEEYVRLGLNDEAILRLFRSPCYSLTHSLYRSRGEARVREWIQRARSVWGQPRFSVRRGNNG